MRRRSAVLPAAAHALSVFASVLAMCGGTAVLQARAAPPTGSLSIARLIAAPDGDGWTAGVVVTLSPKAITYWRSPGEAGVPPTFDFSGSENVAMSTVSFPLPKKVREGDTFANAYEGEVVFPVQVTLADARKPARLVLKLDYATCERICMPARAELAIALPPPPDATDLPLIRQAQASVPRVLSAAEAGSVATVIRDETAAVPSWRIVPRAASSELFAEGPEGFYLETKRSGDAFLVTAEESPGDRRLPDFLRFTLVGPSGAVEFTVPGS